MELTDILTKEEWTKFEKELHDRFFMNCTVYNADGFSFTGTANWCNKLCPAIKANKDSLAAICATGNQYFIAQAKNTIEPVIGECDAGFVKIAVPIFMGDEFLGTAGGCGKLPTGREIGDFMIQKTSGMDDKKIAELSSDLGSITEKDAKIMADYVTRHIADILEGYEKRNKPAAP